MAAFTVCFAGLVVLGGIMADWVNPVALMMGSNLVRGLLQCGMAGLFFSRHVNLWTVCGCTALIGVATASFQPGLAGVVPRLGVDVQKANASVRMAESAIRMAGPAAAGALLGVGAVRNIFLICGITYYSSVPVAWRLWAVCCCRSMGSKRQPEAAQGDRFGAELDGRVGTCPLKKLALRRDRGLDLFQRFCLRSWHATHCECCHFHPKVPRHTLG